MRLFSSYLRGPFEDADYTVDMDGVLECLRDNFDLSTADGCDAARDYLLDHGFDVPYALMLTAEASAGRWSGRMPPSGAGFDSVLECRRALPEAPAKYVWLAGGVMSLVRQGRVSADCGNMLLQNFSVISNGRVQAPVISESPAGISLGFKRETASPDGAGSDRAFFKDPAGRPNGAYEQGPDHHTPGGDFIWPLELPGMPDGARDDVHNALRLHAKGMMSDEVLKAYLQTVVPQLTDDEFEKYIKATEGAGLYSRIPDAPKTADVPPVAFGSVSSAAGPKTGAPRPGASSSPRYGFRGGYRDTEYVVIRIADAGGALPSYVAITRDPASCAVNARFIDPGSHVLNGPSKMLLDRAYDAYFRRDITEAQFIAAVTAFGPDNQFAARALSDIRSLERMIKENRVSQGGLRGFLATMGNAANTAADVVNGNIFAPADEFANWLAGRANARLNRDTRDVHFGAPSHSRASAGGMYSSLMYAVASGSMTVMQAQERLKALGVPDEGRWLFATDLMPRFITSDVYRASLKDPTPYIKRSYLEGVMDFKDARDALKDYYVDKKGANARVALEYATRMVYGWSPQGGPPPDMPGDGNSQKQDGTTARRAAAPDAANPQMPPEFDADPRKNAGRTDAAVAPQAAPAGGSGAAAAPDIPWLKSA